MLLTPRVLRVLVSHALASLAMSLPWPLLLVMVWHSTESDGWLGVAAGARMAPYVALSWWVARIADRVRRDRLVRATLIARTALLGGMAAAIVADRVVLAVLACTMAVALATPAYPALAAGMPRLAGADSRRATDLLVTIEVASFVVGPAVGGLMLSAPRLVGPAAVVCAGLGWAAYAGVRQPRPVAQPRVAPAPASAPASALSTVPAGATHRAALRALAVLGVVNLVVAATGVALLPLAERVWTRGAPTWSDASAYGLATGALGFGALGGPLLGRRGVGIDTRMRRGLWVAGAALATACLAPSVLWVAVPLLLVGAAAVSAEAAATELLQDAVADDRRAGILGVADSVMVLAALVGALVSPLVADWWGPRGVLWLLASGCLLAGVQLRHRAGPALPEPRGSAAPTLVE